MAYRDGQKEIPTTQGYAKFAKKQRMKKMRRAIKKDIDFVPQFNRYHGYL